MDNATVTTGGAPDGSDTDLEREDDDLDIDDEDTANDEAPCHDDHDDHDRTDVARDTRAGPSGDDDRNPDGSGGAPYGDGEDNDPDDTPVGITPGDDGADDAFGYLRGFETRDPDAVAETLEAGDDASFDHPSVREQIETGAAFESTAFADASELENLELRHHRPSRWGRLDLTFGWRRVWKPRELIIPLGPVAPGPHGPIAPRHHDDTIWLHATWRR